MAGVDSIPSRPSQFARALTEGISHRRLPIQDVCGAIVGYRESSSSCTRVLTLLSSPCAQDGPTLSRPKRVLRRNRRGPTPNASVMHKKKKKSKEEINQLERSSQF